jgi:CRISPR-associated exonuclease Cas4
MIYLILCALLLLTLGLALLWLGRRARRQTGLPVGEVIYSDTGAWQQVEEPLISRRHELVGRPDYLVRTEERGQQIIIPVEVKSRKRPAALYDNHVLQLAAYCLLVEDNYKTTPPYGLLHYADATLKIPFTDQLRSQVLAAAEEIRRAQRAPQRAADVARSHTDAARCRHCGYIQSCGEQALWKGDG